jgi:tetratricopeptide (TPR) repeat protein
MAFDTGDPTYQELLATVIRSEAQVVPFVGAGLSVYGEPGKRLPLWRELVKRLVAEGQESGAIPEVGSPAIDALLQAGDYIGAAAAIRDAIGKPAFKRVVERELDDRGKPTPPAATALVCVGWPLIVTTNLDRMLARAYFERTGRPMERVTNLDAHGLLAAITRPPASGEATLAQIHGDLGVYPSWRITRAQYDELLDNPGYVEALKALFERQVLFVGFGLQDDDFDFVLAALEKIFDSGAGEYYALVPRSRKGAPALVELSRICDLRLIYYDVDRAAGPADPFGGHRAVFECLDHLARAWTAERTPLKVTLKYFSELDQKIVGRDRQIQRLADAASAGGNVVQVVGLGGLGKTTLTQQFIAERGPQLAADGYHSVFGCSFYRADIGRFISDMAVATAGAASVSLPVQADRICAHVGRHRTLLVLDGLEAIIDAGWELHNPYVLQIVDSVVRGGGTTVITSRVPVRGVVLDRAPVIEVPPFTMRQILDYLAGWGLDRLGAPANRRLVKITAGHPLALRILAGVLRDVPAEEALVTIERSSVIDVSDEVDPLRENRLARILGSYFHHLSAEGIAYLKCATAFDQPPTYAEVVDALTRRYPDTDVNAPLVERDLRPVVGDLIERRLVTLGTGNELSSHPTVHEYFARQARRDGDSLEPIHRFLADELLRDAAKSPETFEAAVPLIRAARHMAACGDWARFDELFHDRLMRGFRDHLCETLGAWEEALELARLGDAAGAVLQVPGGPGYYAITVARCLKHLGRSAESREQYLDSLRGLAEARDPDTAMYVNNLLTLLVWRGELTDADRLVELNMRALSWIAEPWKRVWQIEHGCSSIAYLRLLQGRFDAAADLFDRSEHAWDDLPEERRWIYDYYPFHRAELILLRDPVAHDDALAAIEALLGVAQEHNWPEAICRGHVQAALVHLDRSDASGDLGELMRATERLDSAREISAGMNLPDVAIAHHLARFKVELARREAHEAAGWSLLELEGLVERIAVLMKASGLALTTPEVLAARGVLSYVEGALERARLWHGEAVEACRKQGNSLALASPRALVHALGRRLDEQPSWEPTGSSLDVAGLLDAELTPEWMRLRIDELAIAGAAHAAARDTSPL